ncbi:MAG: phosphatidylserine decarboxylase [Thermoplasmatota archaeon]
MLAKGTPWWVGVPLAVAILALGATALDLGGMVAIVVAIVFLLLAALTLNFYRDPKRTPGDGVVSPADGVVSGVDVVEGRVRIMIFMSPLDVHVNRMPCDATILRREHVPGGFVPAFKKDSERNERMVWDMETAYGPMRMVQIAGTVARRIVPYVDAGAKLSKGERFGMIRFGSRVDLLLPDSCVAVVAKGQRVKAGSSMIARPRLAAAGEGSRGAAPDAARPASRPNPTSNAAPRAPGAPGAR